MYRSKEIRKHQYFTQPNWSGGVYAAASFPGSRPGNAVATTWATMIHLGEKGKCFGTRHTWWDNVIMLLGSQEMSNFNTPIRHNTCVMHVSVLLHLICPSPL